MGAADERLDLLEHFYSRVVDAVHAFTVEKTTTFGDLVDELVRATVDVEDVEHQREAEQEAGR